MKVIIASDIHGNLEYMNKLDKLIQKENPDKLILLGDLYYHGPRNSLPNEYNPMEVSKILNKYSDKIIAVRGNCDAEVDNMISEFDISKDYEEIVLDENKFYITHGHLFDKLENIIGNNFVFYGHTHVYDLSEKTINPGSVGIPKINKEHTVILYKDKRLKLINLDNFEIINSREI
ncbi:MAG: phosphodiesterase [Clostridia bacterium]|nr:phosphodiesterase [Clostridia bacterium]